jgi:cytochrome P450
MLSLFEVHKQKHIFGDDADEFRPERWYDPKLRPIWNFLPFGGGPRVCPGQQFALTEAGYTVVRILQTFPEIENRDPRPWAPKIRIAVGSQHGVLVSLKN